jgi:hypothetical protein
MLFGEEPVMIGQLVDAGFYHQIRHHIKWSLYTPHNTRGLWEEIWLLLDQML